MSNHAAAQRAAFIDACAELGPDAPTLCEGWATKELVAHVYVREHRPDAAPGVIIGPLSSYTERVMRSALRVHDYDELLDEIRRPPVWWRPVDEIFNTIEFFVHTEDARRANGLDPRPTSPDLEQWVWRRLRRQARMSFRRAPARVRLVTPNGETTDVGKGGDLIEVRGEPTELLLMAFNRKAAARVEISGDKVVLMQSRLGL